MSILPKLKSLIKRLIFKTVGSTFFYRTVMLPNDIKMRVDITDKLGSRWYHQHEPPDAFELELVQKVLRAGDICIDVGANIGLYTLTMARCVGVTGKVYSFEPVPNTFKILSQNIKLNSSNNVVLSEVAVSDKSGTTDITITMQSGLSGLGDTGRGTVVEKRPVSVVKLDDYVRDNSILNIKLLKIDVEGFEGHVLRGAENLLKTENDLIVMVELNSKNFDAFGFSVSGVVSFLSNLGYEGWIISRSNKRLIPITSSNPIGVNFLFSKKNVLVALTKFGISA